MLENNFSQQLFLGNENQQASYFVKSKSQMDQLQLGVKFGLIAYMAIISPAMLQITYGSPTIWIPMIVIAPFFFMGLAGIHYKKLKLMLTFIIFFSMIGIYAFVIFIIAQADDSLDHSSLAIIIYIGMLYTLLFYTIKLYMLLKMQESSQNGGQEMVKLPQNSSNNLGDLENNILQQGQQILHMQKKIDIILLNQQQQLTQNNNAKQELQKPVYQNYNQIIQSDADQQRYVKQQSQQAQHNQQQQQQIKENNQGQNYPKLDEENQQNTEQQQQQQILNSIEASNKQLI